MRRAVLNRIVPSSMKVVAVTVGTSSSTSGVRGIFTNSRPLLAIHQDAAEAKKEQEVINNMKAKYGNNYYSDVSGSGYTTGDGSNSGGGGGSSASSAGGDNSSNQQQQAPFNSFFGGPQQGGGGGQQAQPGAVKVDFPMALTGVILMYCGYKLYQKKQKEQTDPTIPHWCTSLEQQAKYYLFLGTTDATQRQALHNEFDIVRRSNPMLPFFDWLDVRLPSWGMGMQYNRYQALESILAQLRTGEPRTTVTLGSTVSSLQRSGLDSPQRVDKLVADASSTITGSSWNAATSMLSGIAGGTGSTSSGGIPPPPPAMYGNGYAPAQQQQMMGYPPQGQQQYGGQPPMQQQQFQQQPPQQQFGGATNPEYAVGGSGNPNGSSVMFNDVVAGTGVAANQPHGTDPFANNQQQQQQNTAAPIVGGGADDGKANGGGSGMTSM